MSDLANPIFRDETKAREWLEARVWPNGPVCPHCGVIDQATRLQGKSHRPGLHQCNACREPFTVTVGTLYERSKIPLHKWLHATHLLMASKKGMSALQIGRMLGMSKKTAWFVCHRIRESWAKRRVVRSAAKARPWKPTKATSAVVPAIVRIANQHRRKPSLPLSSAAARFAPSLLRDVSAGPLARFLTRDRSIGALISSKFFCEKDFARSRGAPRCRQSVARIRSTSEPLRGVGLWVRSMAA